MADKRKTKKRKEEFGEPTESEKPTSQELSVAKWLKANVPTKKTKFLNHHVEYFTGAKAVDALLTSKWATGKNPVFTTRHDVTDYLHQMLLHKLFHRAKKVPVTEQELKGKSKQKDAEKTSKSGDEKDGEKSQASACEGKDKDSKDKEKEKKKRKIRLEMHLDQVFLDTADAYVWIYDPMPWYYWVCGALVVLGTIGVCMFPLWPATVRKGVYYLSIAAAAFLVMIIALAVLRVVVFCLVWVLTLARHHLWLLPNLTEDVGFFASFWPLYKYEYRGPGSDSDKAAKNKKKRKKDKQSDDEAEKPLLPEPAAEAPPPEPEAKDDVETEAKRKFGWRKKDKQSDDEAEKPLLPEPRPEPEAKDDVETEAKRKFGWRKKDKQSDDEAEKPLLPEPEAKDDVETEAKEDAPTQDKSESESENSQRSSTDRDFEMVDPADLEPDPNNT